MAPFRAVDARSPAQLRKLLEEGRYEVDDSIRSTCESVKRWLSCNQDNLRDFFKECYLPLLNCVLGLQRTGWLTLVDSRPAECASLLDLLRPDGQLFRAMVELDAEGFNQYQLPCKMLAPHTQVLLSTATGVIELQKWPQYREALSTIVRLLQDSIEKQARVPPGRMAGTAQSQAAPSLTLPPPCIVLPLSTSFLMLLAYSALHIGSAARQLRTQTTHHFPGLASRFNQIMHHPQPTHQPQTPDNHPYYRLLRMYLRHLLPQPKSSAASTETAPRQGSAGVVFLCSMIETWLTDLDIPTQGRSQGDLLLGMSQTTNAFGRIASSPSSVASAVALRPTVFVPQNAYQVRAVQELVRHLLLQEVPPAPPQKRGSPTQAPPEALPAFTTASWLPIDSVLVSTAVSNYPMLPVIAGGQGKAGLSALLGPSAGPPLQNVSAHIYRYLRRSFTLWPPGQQRDGLSALRELWLSVCMPWRLARGGGDAAEAPRYTPAWQNHVLAHLPFYHVLAAVFLNLVLACVDFSVDMAFAEALAFGQAFQSEPQLLELLQDVEVAVVRARVGKPLPSSSASGVDMRPLVSAMSVQAVVMERCALAGVSATRPGGLLGPPPAVEPDPTFRLFMKEDVGEAGGAVRSGAPGRAADILAALHDQVSPEKLAQLRQAFAFLHVERFSAGPSGRQPVEAPCKLTCRMLSWGGPSRTAPGCVPYKGEWLYRPVAKTEWGVLVPVLAAASAGMSRWLGFTDDEALKRRHAAVQRVVKFFKRRGMTVVDLRPLFQLESVVFVSAVLLVVYLFAWWVSFLTGLADSAAPAGHAEAY